MSPNQARSIRIETVATKSPQEVIVTEVSYNTGGMSILAGRWIPRAYNLVVKRVRTGNGVQTFAPTEGLTAELEQTRRFSPKRLEEIAKSIRDQPVYKKTLRCCQACE